MIEFKDVVKSYVEGNTALQGVSLHIDDGEFVFLVGPSGSGKSTVIKLITGETKLTEGSVVLNDFHLESIRDKDIPYLRRTVGVVFQDFRLIANKTVYENVAFAMRVIGARDREHQLRRVLQPLAEKFDYILIDCPPSLELLTLNGLCAADGILIPVQCEYYALEGLSDLMATLRAVKRRVNPGLEIFGVVLTMYDGRTNFSAQVAQEVRRHFPGKVFTTMIPRNVRLAEAPSHGLPATAYDRTSRGAQAYGQLADEICQKGAW